MPAPPGPPGALRSWPLYVVLLGIAAGLIVIGLSGAWRTGSMVVGISVLVGALLRLVLPNRGAGLLQVRSRGFDVALMVFVGVGILALAYLVPPGRPR